MIHHDAMLILQSSAHEPAVASFGRRAWYLIFAAAMWLAAANGLRVAVAGSDQQAVFGAPEEAAEALVNALHEGDTQRAENILGVEGEKLLHSGDPIADRKALQRFVAAYGARHRFTYENANKAVLHVGQEDWPLPIPIVRENSAWRFDSAAGAEEILNRRIGKNELNAMQVCLAIVDAQREYAAVDHDGSGVRAFARRFVSTTGTRDGLYWATEDAEEPSPLGPLVAHAVEEGYPASPTAGKPTPYHGYFYRILTAQGGHAKGGAYDYLVDGRMVGGFGLVAYPARYGVSGIMTLIVNHDGVIYEKDLGEDTLRLARGMTKFDPDANWRKVENAVKPGS